MKRCRGGQHEERRQAERSGTHPCRIRRRPGRSAAGPRRPRGRRSRRDSLRRVRGSKGQLRRETGSPNVTAQRTVAVLGLLLFGQATAALGAGERVGLGLLAERLAVARADGARRALCCGLGGALANSSASSFVRSDFWNQTKPCSGAWRTRSMTKTMCVHVPFLRPSGQSHDGVSVMLTVYVLPVLPRILKISDAPSEWRSRSLGGRERGSTGGPSVERRNEGARWRDAHEVEPLRANAVDCRESGRKRGRRQGSARMVRGGRAGRDGAARTALEDGLGVRLAQTRAPLLLVVGLGRGLARARPGPLGLGLRRRRRVVVVLAGQVEVGRGGERNGLLRLDPLESRPTGRVSFDSPGRRTSLRQKGRHARSSPSRPASAGLSSAGWTGRRVRRRRCRLRPSAQAGP